MKVSKTLAAIFILISVFSFTTVSAQEDREDVIYLKNGNVYHGIIIEQVPGQTMKIETLGGNVFTVQITDILKVTKEKKVAINNTPAPAHGSGEAHHHSGGNETEVDYDRNRHYSYRDETHRVYKYHRSYYDQRNRRDRFDSICEAYKRMPYQYRNKGYFFKVQLLAEAGQGGGRIINGYKFGQFGYLGIGVGADIIGFAPVGRYDFGGRSSPYTGTYFPLFLHYSGDITRKRIAPFYTVEAGYAMRVNAGRSFGRFGNNGPFRNDRQGGIMGGVGIGVKFSSKHRLNFNISANADFQNVKYYPGYNTSGDRGMTYRYANSSIITLLTPGLKFGLGF